MKWAGLGGGGLVATLVARDIFSPSSKPISPQSFNFEVVTVNSQGAITNRKGENAKFFKEDLGHDVTLEMVSIPGDKFMMGTEEGEIERLVKKYKWAGFKSEKPPHKVTIKSFWMGKYPVTQEQWQTVMGLKNNRSNYKDIRNPVEMVSWDDAVKFCKKLSEKTRKEYRLPSEAEWEYACRAKSITPFYFGETITGDLANYNATKIYADEEPKDESQGKTIPVGGFPPNSFGLYDMHGNVWELCADDWHKNHRGAPVDGSAWVSKPGIMKVRRGGSWNNEPSYCRSSARTYVKDYNYREDNIGFRVVCVASQTI